MKQMHDNKREARSGEATGTVWHGRQDFITNFVHFITTFYHETGCQGRDRLNSRMKPAQWTCRAQRKCFARSTAGLSHLTECPLARNLCLAGRSTQTVKAHLALLVLFHSPEPTHNPEQTLHCHQYPIALVIHHNRTKTNEPACQYPTTARPAPSTLTHRDPCRCALAR